MGIRFWHCCCWLLLVGMGVGRVWCTVVFWFLNLDLGVDARNRSPLLMSCEATGWEVRSLAKLVSFSFIFLFWPLPTFFRSAKCLVDLKEVVLLL